MNQKKMPTGKLSRAVKTGLTTAHISLKHAAFISKKPFTNTADKTQQQYLHEQDVGKILINSLMQLRGTALKIAQMMSLELDMLPEAIRIELAKAFSEVTPLNRAHIRKVFINEFNQAPEKIFDSFESTAFAAASLGQVHLAINNNQQKLAVKIQYPGIAASISSDMKLVRGIMKSLSVTTSYLPRYEIIDCVLDRIQLQLEHEIDYQLEAKNTEWFYNNLKLTNIIIPTVYKNQSSLRVLVTEYIEGEHLTQWLKKNPDKKQRNKLGQIIFDLFCFQLHELNTLHADPHPGNLIFCENDSIALIDFGCIHQLQPGFSNKVIRLFTNDPVLLYQAYHDLKIINESLTYRQFCTSFFPVVEQLYSWMAAPYKQDYYDFSTIPALPKKPLSQIKTAMNFIDTMQQDQMYFDRSYLGLLSLLRKLKATVNTTGLIIR